MNNFLELIKKKLNEGLKIESIQIINNTHKHKTHKNFNKNLYHLALEIESRYLKNLDKIKAQREVMNILKDELKSKIHALEIKIK